MKTPIRMPHVTASMKSRQIGSYGFSEGDFVVYGPGFTRAGIVMAINRSRVVIFTEEGEKIATPISTVLATEGEPFDPSQTLTPGCIVTLGAKEAKRFKVSTERTFVIIGESQKGECWKLVPVNHGLDVPYTSVSVLKDQLVGPIIVKEDIR